MYLASTLTVAASGFLKTVKIETDFAPRDNKFSVNQESVNPVSKISSIIKTSRFKISLSKSYNFSSTSNSLTYTGTTSAMLRVSVNMVLSQGNGNQVKIYIAKNGTIIAQSMADLTLSHANGHAVFTETVLQGAVNDEFTIYINAMDSASAITISALTFTAHTL